MPTPDLTTKRFGKLVVIEKLAERQNGAVLWRCQCDCGRTSKTTTHKLTSGRTQSCGCSSDRFSPDISGQRFGFLVVIKDSETRYRGNKLWECLCDCGNTSLVTTVRLKSSKTRSCGCYQPYIEMTGKQIGHLLVIKIAARAKEHKGILWECLCTCGNTCYVTGPHLRAGNIQNKSCGCVRRAMLGINIRKAIASRTKSDEEADMRYLLTSYKSGAKDRGLEWALSIERFAWLIKQNCSYCGVLPYQARNAERYRNTPYNGIDRANNSIGYTVENAVPCCAVCNQAKHAKNADEFKEWILRAAEHLRSLSGSSAGTNEVRAAA